MLILLYCVVFTVFILSFAGYSKYSKKKAEDIMAEDWTLVKPLHKFLYFDQIKSLAKYSPKGNFYKLSSQTQNDLDLDSVFAHIDRTISCVGQQYLFQSLIHPKLTKESLIQDEKRIVFFQCNPDIAIKLRTKLIKLSHPHAYSIAKLINDPNFKNVKWYPLLVLDSVLLLLSIFLLPIFPKILIVVVILLLCVNMGLYFWNKSNVLMFTNSLPQLRLMILTAAKINRELFGQDREKVAQSLKKLSFLKRKMSLISFDFFSNDADPSQILKYIGDLLKAVFLIEVHVFFMVLKDITELKNDLSIIFDFVASYDYYISIAALRSASNTKFCVPHFISNKSIQFRKVYHPLIPNCVPNDLLLKENSCLITGSNMSGKSSFLRTAAINAILAQSIHTCYADEYSAPMFKVYTSLQVSDDLSESKSYYKAEVDLISSLIRHSVSDIPCLFLLDEVFKGTNTLERVSAAAAVLKYLSHGNNMVFVATHDIELVELLQFQYDSYHFQEEIVDGRFYFDHKIKGGAVEVTNAINILEISDFPDEIINEAKLIFSYINPIRNNKSQS